MTGSIGLARAPALDGQTHLFVIQRNRDLMAHTTFLQILIQLPAQAAAISSNVGRFSRINGSIRKLTF